MLSYMRCSYVCMVREHHMYTRHICVLKDLLARVDQLFNAYEK